MAKSVVLITTNDVGLRFCVANGNIFVCHPGDFPVSVDSIPVELEFETLENDVSGLK